MNSNRVTFQHNKENPESCIKRCRFKLEFSVLSRLPGAAIFQNELEAKIALKTFSLQPTL